MYRPLFALAIAAIAIPSLIAGPAAAQDVAAPSQALSSDPAPPLPRLAATVDPVGMAFGEWTARLELALLPAHSAFVEGGYRDSALSPGISVELGYHLFFLGDGLDGPFIGPSVGLAVTTDRAEVAVYGALEAGWQVVLGPIALGLAGGVEAHLSFPQEVAVALAPRISVSVGYALR